MALFKKKLSLEAAMRMALGEVVKRSPDHALAIIAANNGLPLADITAIKKELPAFDVALWWLLFFQIAGDRLGAKEFTKRFTISLYTALKDSGVPDHELEACLDATGQRLRSYVDYLSSVPEKEQERKGLFFYYCQHFTNSILEKEDLSDAFVRDRHFQIFDIASQNYEGFRATFEALGQEYRFVML